MQSTKLAEILFSVRSLFDIQSDEYFMFVMCLYASVGPTLFFVLVDTSVIFRKCLVEVRNGFRMPFRNSSSVASLFKTAESFSLDPTSSDTTMTSTDSCVQPVRYLKRHVSSLEGPGESSAKDENNASKADNEPHTFG